jgi:hypothetical protein
MSTFLLLGVLLVNVALLAVALGALYRARQLASAIESRITSFFNAPDDKTPSEFARMIDLAAAVLSARIITSAEAAIRGAKGGTQKGINAEAFEEQAKANPLVALFGAKLGKNPLAMTALSLLGGKLMGNSSTPVASGSNGTSPKFKL